MKKLSQILESGAPKLTSLLSNFSGLKTLSSRLEKPKREKNVAEPDSALAFKSADLVEPEVDAIAATEAVQLAQAEAQAATDTDAGGVLFGGDGGVITATATGSVGIGVGSVFATGALLRNSGSNGSGQVAPSGGSAVNPGGNEPLEEINSLGMDFTAREVTTPGVSIKTTAAGEIKGTTTVGAIYTDVDVQKRTLTVDNTQVNESTRLITEASAVKVTADGFINLSKLSEEASSFIDTFEFNPAFEGFIEELFGLVGVQSTVVELTSKNADIEYSIIGGGSKITQLVPDSTTVFQSLVIDYSPSESVKLEALNGRVQGDIVIANSIDIAAESIVLGFAFGKFSISSEVTRIDIGDEPEDVSYELFEEGTFQSAEEVTLVASQAIEAGAVVSQNVFASGSSVSGFFLGGGILDLGTLKRGVDRDLGVLPVLDINVTSTSSTKGSSLVISTLAGSVNTAGSDDEVIIINARGVEQTATLNLGDGDDVVTFRSLYGGDNPGGNFSFSGGQNGTYTLTIKDGMKTEDVYTLSGVETVEVRSSIVAGANADLLARFALMDGVYTLLPIPNTVA